MRNFITFPLPAETSGRARNIIYEGDDTIFSSLKCYRYGIPQKDDFVVELSENYIKEIPFQNNKTRSYQKHRSCEFVFPYLFSMETEKILCKHETNEYQEEFFIITPLWKRIRVVWGKPSFYHCCYRWVATSGLLQLMGDSPVRTHISRSFPIKSSSLTLQYPSLSNTKYTRSVLKSVSYK